MKLEEVAKHAIEEAVKDFSGIVLEEEWYKLLMLTTELIYAIHFRHPCKGILVKHHKEETIYITETQLERLTQHALSGKIDDGIFGRLIYGYTEGQYNHYKECGVDLGKIAPVRLRILESYRSVSVIGDVPQYRCWFDADQSITFVKA